MAPTCTNCNGTDFVWANELKTGGVTGAGGLSLRSRGEVPLGTRICRTCGHAELFLRDLSLLHQPHNWKPGEFIPIPHRPRPAPSAPAPSPPAPAAPPAPPLAQPAPTPAAPMPAPAAPAPTPPPLEPEPATPAPLAAPSTEPASASAPTEEAPPPEADSKPKAPRRRSTKSR